MRWKTTTAPSPKQGETKIVVRRAWWPRRIVDITAWMEQYETLYVYQEATILATFGNEKAQVTVGQWIKVSEKLIKWQAH